MSQLAAADERPLRADARRNREKVLAAARSVFSEHGRDAQIEDVARRGGVGVGTVYRHFPTKEALIEALMVDSFEATAAEGVAATPRDRARRAARGRGVAAPPALSAPRTLGA